MIEYPMIKTLNMGPAKIIFFPMAMLFGMMPAVTSHAAQMTPQIQELLHQKEEKAKQLESCDGKRKAWMIAGISTIGLTAVGIGVNIAQAGKSKKLDTSINSANTMLKNQQTELDRINTKIAEKKHQQLNNSRNNKQGIGSENSGADNEETEFVNEENIVDPDMKNNPTEPEVDVTKWTEVTYKLCNKNFSPGSSNARSFLSRSNNGQYCDGEGGGNEYDFKRNPNTCSQQRYKQVGNGEWKVLLKDGRSLKGIAVCSNTEAGEVGELREEIDTSGSGLNCWCQLTETDLSECLVTPKFSWAFIEKYWLVDNEDMQDLEFGYEYGIRNLMPSGYYQRGQNTCPWLCALECGHRVYDLGKWLQRSLHGVPFIEQYM